MKKKRWVCGSSLSNHLTHLIYGPSQLQKPRLASDFLKKQQQQTKNPETHPVNNYWATFKEIKALKVADFYRLLSLLLGNVFMIDSALTVKINLICLKCFLPKLV